MKSIKQLENQSKKLREKMFVISNEITDHLRDKFEASLDSYDSFDDFLVDINNYAGDSFGKLMYINSAKNKFKK